MTRSIDINLSLCQQPCQICDQIVPGIRARIKKIGPVMIRGWAWLEQGAGCILFRRGSTLDQLKIITLKGVPK